MFRNSWFVATSLLVCGSAVQAQFYAPHLPPSGRINSVTTNPAQLIYNTPYRGIQPAYSSYGYYPSNGIVYLEDPISGYFNGIANLTSAYGQYGIDYQQARLLGQDVERSKIATRRAFIEQQMWEQSLQPKAEDVRRYQMETELRRALNDPPLTDIISGSSLNTLLQNIINLQNRGGLGPNIPLDTELLRSINLIGAPGSSVALFKDEGKLRFPFVLRDTAFDKQRQDVQDLVSKAVRESQVEELSASTYKSLQTAVANLEATVTKEGPNLSLTEAIEASRFLDELRDGVNALRHPDASKQLTKKIAAQGKSVGDLVQHMKTNGLRFAPSQSGEESAYRSMQQSLVAYNLGIMQTVRK